LYLTGKFFHKRELAAPVTVTASRTTTMTMNDVDDVDDDDDDDDAHDVDDVSRCSRERSFCKLARVTSSVGCRRRAFK